MTKAHLIISNHQTSEKKTNSHYTLICNCIYRRIESILCAVYSIECSLHCRPHIVLQNLLLYWSSTTELEYFYKKLSKSIQWSQAENELCFLTCTHFSIYFKTLDSFEKKKENQLSNVQFKSSKFKIIKTGSTVTCHLKIFK